MSEDGAISAVHLEPRSQPLNIISHANGNNRACVFLCVVQTVDCRLGSPEGTLQLLHVIRGDSDKIRPTQQTTHIMLHRDDCVGNNSYVHMTMFP